MLLGKTYYRTWIIVFLIVIPVEVASTLMFAAYRDPWIWVSLVALGLALFGLNDAKRHLTRILREEGLRSLDDHADKTDKAS